MAWKEAHDKYHKRKNEYKTDKALEAVSHVHKQFKHESSEGPQLA